MTGLVSSLIDLSDRSSTAVARPAVCASGRQQRVHRPQPVLVPRQVSGDIRRVRQMPGEWHRQALLRPAPEMGRERIGEHQLMGAPWLAEQHAFVLQRLGEGQHVEGRNELIQIVHRLGRVVQRQSDRLDEVARRQTGLLL